MINLVRYVDLGEARLARKKHIITCSGAPRHAVIEPCRMAVVVALAQCETLGEKQSKNGHDPKVMPVVFIGGVPWRAATIAMLSENAQRAFYGRIRFRPYRIGIQ